MAKDYKKTIRGKRLEAGKLMTQKQIGLCNGAIHTASVAAAAAGFVPIPAADAVPISAAQITMVIALGKIFDQKITESAAKGAIAAAAATFVGRNLVKLIPFVGWGISAAVAAGVTEAIGWTIAVDLAMKYRTEYGMQRYAEEAANAQAEADYYRNLSDSSFDDVDDFSNF